jgi:hypothetical protein
MRTSPSGQSGAWLLGHLLDKSGKEERETGIPTRVILFAVALLMALLFARLREEP